MKFEKQLAKEAKERQAHGKTAPGKTLVAKMPQANQYSSPVEKIAESEKGGVG